MASYTLTGSQVAAHDKTLVAATVDTVTFPGHVGKVEVLNINGAAAIYFTVDGSTPTVSGANTYALPAAVASREVRAPATGTTVVKLISAGTPTYSVTGD